MSALNSFQDSSPAEATSFSYLHTSASQTSVSTALASDAPPPSPPKKKRSHGKSRPAGHIPRPPNAFIIFRTDYIRAQESQKSTPEVSKRLGDIWKAMSAEEKEPWIARAETEKMEHKHKYPNYKFKPIHPRDEYGNCIRKPRKPNKPRAKKGAHRGEIMDDLSSSPPPQWPYTIDHGVNEYPPSASPPASPPATPPPPSHSFLRRSSSVPLPMSDNTFFFGAEFGMPTYAGFPMTHNAQLVRRLSKRPSTSMDFTCPGSSSFFPLQSGNEQHTMAEASTEWRLGHRRSLSAPGLGEFIGTQLAHYPGFNGFAPEANPLTPINPDFNSVFSAFSWSTAGSGQQQTNPLNADISAVPSMSSSPSSSNFSSATSFAERASPTPTPPQHIVQPAPIAKFDVSAFQAQMFELEGVASALRVENLGFDNMLGLTTPDMGEWEADIVNAGFGDATARQETTAPQTLHFNELIVENY